MKRLAVSVHFQRQLKKLHEPDRRKAIAALKEFLDALQSGKLPHGLGFKKINADKYELRVDIRVRIVMKMEDDTLICHLIGNHEDVRRYLQDYRSK